MVTESRIGEALQADLGEIRAQETELGALTSRKTLESIPELLTAAEVFAKGGRAEEALEWIARWVRDLLLIRVGADPDCMLRVTPPHDVQELAETAPVDGLLDLLETIEAFQRAATRNVNLHLALENVLLRLRETLYSEAHPVR